jgi:hypothetical protein
MFTTANSRVRASNMQQTSGLKMTTTYFYCNNNIIYLGECLYVSP